MLGIMQSVLMLTLLMLETNNSGLEANTMPADALAPKVTSASASMV